MSPALLGGSRYLRHVVLFDPSTRQRAVPLSLNPERSCSPSLDCLLFLCPSLPRSAPFLASALTVSSVRGSPSALQWDPQAQTCFRLAPKRICEPSANSPTSAIDSMDAYALLLFVDQGRSCPTFSLLRERPASEIFPPGLGPFTHMPENVSHPWPCTYSIYSSSLVVFFFERSGITTFPLFVGPRAPVSPVSMPLPVDPP